MNNLINIFKINGKFIQTGNMIDIRYFTFFLTYINIIYTFSLYKNFRVYCDYFHSSERRFENPEDKLLHFMEKIFSPDWEWREQYPASNFENISMDDFDRRKGKFIFKIKYL